MARNTLRNHAPRGGRDVTAPKTAQLDAAQLRGIHIARVHLCDHYAEKVTLAELARLAHLSPFCLARLFRAHIGMPPHAYQIQLRVEQAKLLLAAGGSVSDVAQEAGFFDLSHFTRHFKRHVGISPGVFGEYCRAPQDAGDEHSDAPRATSRLNGELVCADCL
jgi:AraC-like DNA-binding protein